MSACVLSIGSNLGDRLGILRAAVDALRPWLRAVSPVYETPPWGPVPQDDYLNAVAVVTDPAAGARDWLERAHAAERAAGRTREVRWGPRTLDIDVVTVRGEPGGDGAGTEAGEVVSADPELTLPHPRAHERAFVLVPWLDLEPMATLSGRSLVSWLDELPVGDRAGLRRLEQVLSTSDGR